MNRWLRLCLIVLVMFVIAGCFDNRPLKESAIVVGTGIDKGNDEKGYTISMEILRVGTGGQSTGGGEGGAERKSVVLQIQADNLFEGTRNMIRYAKRRLFHTHNRVWIISEDAARDNILKPFDPIFRDQMLRLNSFLFVSKDKPEEILTTSTLLESLNSLELAVSMDALQFVGNFGGLFLMDIFQMMSGPVQTAFVPVIALTKEPEGTVTGINGMAILKKDKMVGLLDNRQAFGLMLLRGNVEGGFLRTKPGKQEGNMTIELQRETTKLRTKLRDGELTTDVFVHVRGTIATVPNDVDLSKPGTKRNIEQDVEVWLKELIDDTLHTLQKDLKADVTDIGLQTYRMNPREWHKVQNKWDEVFAEAKITVHVAADVYHPGLTYKSKGSIDPKPERNPYRRLLDWIPL